MADCLYLWLWASQAEIEIMILGVSITTTCSNHKFWSFNQPHKSKENKKLLTNQPTNLAHYYEQFTSRIQFILIDAGFEIGHRIISIAFDRGLVISSATEMANINPISI